MPSHPDEDEKHKDENNEDEKLQASIELINGNCQSFSTANATLCFAQLVRSQLNVACEFGQRSQPSLNLIESVIWHTNRFNWDPSAMPTSDLLKADLHPTTQLTDSGNFIGVMI